MKEYHLGIYEKAFVESHTIVEKLDMAKRVGYDFLELSIDESDEKLARLTLDSSQRFALLQATREILPIGSICLSGHRRFPLGGRETEQRALTITRQALELAAYVGIPIIQLAGYDVYYEASTDETRERFITNLATCATLAAQYGVILAFETMETPFMNSVEKAMEYVRMINSPYLQVYPDLGNVVNGSEDPVEDLLSGAGHLAAVHIKESKPGHFREIPYGEGHVDFAQLLATSWDLGVRRYVTEFWHNSAQDYKAQIIDSYNYITTAFFIDKGGVPSLVTEL
jgi:L-ribulose-5-phosphate 3-epimerase